MYHRVARLRKLVYVTSSIVVGSLTLSACTSNQTTGAAQGAAAGAGSAMLVGALTDLIVDGKVNTHRLQRNAVSGAIVGGAAGAAHGTAKDKAQAAEQTKAAEPTTSQTQDQKKADLIAKIGPHNYESLALLVACKHPDAYRVALEEEHSQNKQFQEASLAIRALIDKDRNNEPGSATMLRQFVENQDDGMTFETAQTELGKLHGELKQERQVQGISPDCA